MSEHTPPTSEVHWDYVMHSTECAKDVLGDAADIPSFDEAWNGFESWLAGIVRDAKAEALRDAAEDINGESHLLQCPRPETRAQSWLLDRAEAERTDDA